MANSREKFPQTKKEGLPREARFIQNLYIKNGEEKIALPLYEYSEAYGKDEREETIYFYVVGWPKTMISGPLKLLIETSPWWGETHSFEDDGFYYYRLGVIRKEGEELPKNKVNARMKFLWEQAQSAFGIIEKMGTTRDSQ